MASEQNSSGNFRAIKVENKTLFKYGQDESKGVPECGIQNQLAR